MSGIHEQFDSAMERMEDAIKEGAPATESLGWIQRGERWYEIQVTLQGDEDEWIGDPDTYDPD